MFQEKMDLVAQKIALVSDETIKLDKTEKEQAEAARILAEQEAKNAQAKQKAAQQSKELEKQLLAEAEARRKNNQSLIDENQSFANRNRVLGQAGSESIQGSDIEGIKNSVDAEIRERGRISEFQRDQGNALKALDDERREENLELISFDQTALEHNVGKPY